jgi:hypothetical protein
MQEVETKQLPIFIVEGANWKAEVGMDEYNCQFSLEEQALEAATKAIEAFKGIENGVFVRVTNDNENTPFLGPMVRIYVKTENPKNDMVAFSHIVLGNGGFYSDSIEMLGVLKIEEPKILELLKKQSNTKLITPPDKKTLKKSIGKCPKLKKQINKKPRRKKP